MVQQESIKVSQPDRNLPAGIWPLVSCSKLAKNRQWQENMERIVPCALFNQHNIFDYRHLHVYAVTFVHQCVSVETVSPDHSCPFSLCRKPQAS